MEIKKEFVYSLDSDANETRVIAACSDRTVKMYKVDETVLEIINEYKEFPGPVTQAIFLGKGEMFCVSCYTGEIIIFKIEGINYSKKFEKKIFEGSINSISHNWNLNSFVIYCGCSDGNLRILNFDENFKFLEKIIFCNKFGITSVSTNTNYILTGGMDYEVVLLDLNGIELKRFKNHTGFIRQVGMASLSEFDILCFASCSEDGKLCIYFKDEEDYKNQIIDLKSPVYSVSWCKTGYSLSVSYGENSTKTFVPNQNGEFVEIELIEKDL